MGSSINSRTEKLFQFFWTAFFIIITIIAMVPILRVISMSFSTKEAILAGKVMVWPVGFTLEAYDRALNSGSFVRAFGYSIVLMNILVPLIERVSLPKPFGSRKGDGVK